jgi:hypothetical protein
LWALVACSSPSRSPSKPTQSELGEDRLAESELGKAKPGASKHADEDTVVWTPRAPIDGRLRVAPPGMCGGARVPNDYRRPPLAPVNGVALRVMPGDIYSDQVITTVTTDREGKFTGDLSRAGRYCISRDHGARPPQPPPSKTPAPAQRDNDPACLLARWQKCDAVIDVPVQTPALIDIHEPCAWTICYNGPPPP